MELLVRAVLLGSAQADAFGDDAQPHPPDIQARQAPQPGAGKRAAVVTSNAHRQPELGKAPLEAAPRQPIAATEQRVAPQDVPAEAIAQRQRITIAVVPRAELAFEVRRPRVVRAGDRTERMSAVWHPRSARPRHDPALPAQQITHRRSARPGRHGIPATDQGEEFLRPPTRMTTADRDQGVHQRPVGRGGLRQRPPRLIQQRREAPGLRSLDPLVTRLPADAGTAPSAPSSTTTPSGTH